MPVPVPDDLADLTPTWLSAALREGGALDAGTAVAAVDVERTGADTGFLGVLARLHLRYEGSAHPPGPPALVAKLPTHDPGGRAVGMMLGVWPRESRFFAEVAPSCGARVPRCYYNGADPAAGRWALLLEDCGAGLDQLAGAGDDQARAAVDTLARLHAPWWGAARPWDWMPGFDRPLFDALQPAMTAALDPFTARFGHQVPRRTLGWLARFVDHLPRWAADQATGPLTLVHADYRLDNLLFPAGGDPVVVDWQTALWGPGPMDLASFCATSLTVEDRRRLEGELVERYAAGLSGAADATAVRARYRSCLLWWMAIYANNLSRIEPGAGRGALLFEQMVQRTFTAADDHDAGDLLG